MRLLDVPQYRKDVLSGIVISIGSKTDSTVRDRYPSFHPLTFTQGLFFYVAKTGGE